MRRLIAVAIGVVVLASSSASEVDAAGVTTHAWMGLDAIDLVSDPDLHAILDAHRGQVEGGAQYPDSGYMNNVLNVPGGDYGEEAHWQRFHDAYAEQIMSRNDCGDLTDPDGPCAPEIAHLMGMAAHGLGDQVWDWLFEPYAPQHGEEFLPPELSAFIGPGGIEFQMDMIAIARHARWTAPDTPALPSVTDLHAAFTAVGRPDITEFGLTTGKTNMGSLRNIEGILTPQYADQVEAAMPWTSANFLTAPGGVEFGAAAIAALYENLWGKLLGDQPPTEVSITYPLDGQSGVPATGWVANFGPGSHPNRGPATNRIAAVLTYSRPYVEDASDPNTHIPQELPAGSMALVDTTNGLPVPLMAGYPKSVPYGPDAGEHMIALQPAADLHACTTYLVRVTEALLDANLDPVRPTQWRFTTDGCPDLPPTTSTTSTTSTTDPVEPGAPSTTSTRVGLSAAPVAFDTPLGILPARPARALRVAPAYTG
jgi:hypothetical protein